MRERLAKAVALFTGVLVVGGAFLFGAFQRTSPDVAVAGPADARAVEERVQPADTLVEMGRRVYEEQDCALCHSIAGEGSPRSPLDGVGDRLDAEELRLWVVDPQAVSPGVRKPAYDDLPEDEVEAVVAYLQSLTNSNR